MVPELMAVQRESSGQIAVADNLAKARNVGDYYQQADQVSAVGSNYYSYQKCILT